MATCFPPQSPPHLAPQKHKHSSSDPLLRTVSISPEGPLSYSTSCSCSLWGRVQLQISCFSTSKAWQLAKAPESPAGGASTQHICGQHPRPQVEAAWVVPAEGVRVGLERIFMPGTRAVAGRSRPGSGSPGLWLQERQIFLGLKWAQAEAN